MAEIFQNLMKKYWLTNPINLVNSKQNKYKKNHSLEHYYKTVPKIVF